EALAKAAEIRTSIELRNEAIAAFALVDLRVLKTRQNPDAKSQSVAWDATMERYAVVTAGKDIVVRRIADDGEIARLPAIYGGSSYAHTLSPDGASLPVLQQCGL